MTADAPAAVRPYDFRPRVTLGRDQLESLRPVWDSFARHTSVLLAEMLAKPVTVEVHRVAELPWREVVAAVGDDPWAASFHLAQLPGHTQLPGLAAIATPTGVALRLVELRLGGGGVPRFDGHQRVSATDMALLRPLIAAVLDELAQRLPRSGTTLGAEMVTADSGAWFSQMASATDPHLTLELELVAGDDPPATLVVALPFALVHHLATLTRPGTADEEAGRTVDPAVVLQAPLAVTVGLPEIALAADELADLAVGDVLRFGHPLRKPLDVRADGVLVARATRGHVGSKLVCSIVEEVTEDEY